MPCTLITNSVEYTFSQRNLWHMAEVLFIIFLQVEPGAGFQNSCPSEPFYNRLLGFQQNRSGMQEVLWGLLGKKGHSKAESIHSKPHKKWQFGFSSPFSPQRETPREKLPSPVRHCLCLSSWYNLKEVIQAPGKILHFTTQQHVVFISQ